MKALDSIFDRLYTGDDKINFLDQKYLPRWIILLIDIFLGGLSFLIVFFIIQNTPIKFLKVLTVFQQSLVIIGFNTLFFFLFRTYSGIIRHSTFLDITKLGLSAFFTFVTLLAVNFSYELANGEKVFLTTSLILYLLLSFSLMLMFRIFVKEGYQYLKNISVREAKKKLAIYGVDDDTIAIGKAMIMESRLPFQLIGFLGDGIESKRLKLLGQRVIPVGEDVKQTLQSMDIDALMFVGNSMPAKKRNILVDQCLALNIEVLNVPVMESWNTKEDIRKKIKPLQIEDLLERPEIRIDNDLIKKDLEGKTILVTGGAGSIGKEIVLQLAQFSPKLVVILDQAESALHELEQQLTYAVPHLPFIIELADISNMYRLEQMFDKYKFDLVYHAAAYKHVPLIERNPHEAIYVNVLGTVNLSILAMKYEIEKFVMISTDKAVNPTNVMGASKRVAEMYVQALHHEKGVFTRFITTRFGNVLGSSGSVIPYFKKQIEHGGPVTVTHKEIIRYFMTISEACQLVLQAGTMGKGGEIFVFDMGNPVKILDLAEKMIRLSGLEPYEDIDIEITGLRPGEKLYEELLSDASTTLPTHHPKIMISKDPVANFIRLKRMVKEVIKTAAQHDDVRVVRLLKDLVPEFKSENSIFEKLDSDDG